MQKSSRVVLLIAVVCGVAYALQPASLSADKADSASKAGESNDTPKKVPEGKFKKQVNEADVKALGPLQNFIGSWSGVGAPRRGATEGMWQELSNWAWRFDTKRTAIGFSSPKGKYLISGRIEPGKKAGQFILKGMLPDGKTQKTYTGQLDKSGQWVFTLATTPKEAKATTDVPARISMRLVARGKRMVIYLEKRLGENQFARLGEVGYTRKGSGFGKATVVRECVVTGGQSSTLISYKGKSYYVCCTGCRKYFLEDPEAAIAEYHERKAKEAEKKKKKDADT